MRRVEEVMTARPVVVSAWESVAVGRRVAREAGVHHLVLDDVATIVGVVCLCDLAEADETSLLAGQMQSPFAFITPASSIQDAAETMLDRGVGCLPVLDELDELVGVVTRRDLRGAGALPGSRGIDACAACGATHSLRPRAESGEVVFCVECSERARPHADYTLATLGGSD